MHALDAAVSALMREVGRDVVMSRFGRLGAADIEEKARKDFVTVADRESEARLTAMLPAILSGSHVVGEEAVAADPSLLGKVADGRAWIVDPIDGTGNYAAGRSPFAIMVALADRGIVQAGWILDPASGRMCHASLGGGAFVNGRRVAARETDAERPIAALATRYLPSDIQADVERRATGRLTAADIPHCAGEQYPRIVLGAVDIALFWRSMPWDHAPGALFVEEAGGRVARLDGSPYRPGDDRTGILAAASPRLWDEAAAILFG